MVRVRHEINKKTKNKKKITFFDTLKRIIFWFIFFSFWGAALWVILFSPVMEIKEIEINGVSEEKQEIKNIVENNISGKYFDFIPKDNLIIFPARIIKRDILNEFIMVRKVNIKREFPAKIIVQIERREMFVIWCKDSECWFVDEHAEAFYQIAKQDIEQANKKAVVTDGSGKIVEKGTKVADVKIIKLCNNLSKIIESESAVEIDQKSIYIPSPMSGEIRVKTNQGWEIYFSTERSILIQTKILKKILNSKFTKEDINELEYIDLRIKGKVIYRFKNYKERMKEIEESEVQSEKSD